MRSASWLLVGGGLANALLALRLERIGTDFLIVERASQLLGGQTWSCQLSDIPAEDRDLVLELADYRWDSYAVKFPKYTRAIRSPYITIRAECLRAKLKRVISPRKIRLETEAKSSDVADAHIVRATGFSGAAENCGYQKFVGWDLEFEHPHGLQAPILMDANVLQKDGYRFFYLLPFTDRTMLVEETRYSNSPMIDHDDFAAGIKEYLRDHFPKNSWKSIREEHGSLPIPWTMPTPAAGLFGMAGGFFHPSTGYSLPIAVRTSRQLLEKVGAGLSVEQALAEISRADTSARKYYLMLNRMMFLAARPVERRRIFERFYGLKEDLIERFYAGNPTTLDKLRMLSGRPPVKIIDAVRAFTRETPAWN